jgi:hypothetical protein
MRGASSSGSASKSGSERRRQASASGMKKGLRVEGARAERDLRGEAVEFRMEGRARARHRDLPGMLPSAGVGNSIRVAAVIATLSSTPTGVRLRRAPIRPTDPADTSNVTDGKRPGSRATSINPAPSSATSARDFAALSTPNGFRSALPSVIVLLFNAPASRHKLKPTISALPGKAAAATIQGHGTGPFKNRPAEPDRSLAICSSAYTSPSTASPLAVKRRLPLSQTSRSIRTRFANTGLPLVYLSIEIHKREESMCCAWNNTTLSAHDRNWYQIVLVLR